MRSARGARPGHASRPDAPSSRAGSSTSARYRAVWKGCTWNPSALRPARRARPGPTPAMDTGIRGPPSGRSKVSGGGLKNGDISDKSRCSLCNRNGAPSCHVAQAARAAAIHSARRGAGALQGIPNRRSTCARTCVPRPSRNRPSESAARSKAVWASATGLRANATAMPVPTRRRAVAESASPAPTNGSCSVSASHMASKPNDSASRAIPPTADGGGLPAARSTFMRRPPRATPAV